MTNIILILIAFIVVFVVGFVVGFIVEGRSFDKTLKTVNPVLYKQMKREMADYLKHMFDEILEKAKTTESETIPE